MSTNQEPARDAARAEPEIAHLSKLFIDQIRAQGRVHHRTLLKGMRKLLGSPATETAQEVSMVLKGKLRLRPLKVKDIEGVRKALGATSGGDAE